MRKTPIAPLLTSSGCNETPNRIEFRCASKKRLSESASMPLRETNSNFSFHHKSPVSFGQPDVRLRNLHLRRPESGLTPFPEEDLSLSIHPFLPLSWRSHILQSRLEHSAPDLRISKRGMCEMASGGPSETVSRCSLAHLPNNICCRFWVSF